MIEDKDEGIKSFLIKECSEAIRKSAEKAYLDGFEAGFKTGFNKAYTELKGLTTEQS
jgi:hypothetical protein